MQLFYGTTLDGLQMGLCFAILALGLYISYTILDFPDLSVDGTFPLGGVICTILLYRAGLPPLVAIALSFFVGMAAGAVTGFLHVRFRISNLLSGIIVMTALLSVNLALTTLLTPNGYTTTIFSYRGGNIEGLFSGHLTGYNHAGQMRGPLICSKLFGEPVKLNKGGQDILKMLSPIVFKATEVMEFRKGTIPVVVNIIERSKIL